MTPNWQPIETATTTGDTDVLLYCADTGEQFVGYPSGDDHTVWIYAHYRTGEVGCRPSHWAPLPEGPR
jgi:hypothetical protein